MKTYKKIQVLICALTLGLFTVSCDDFEEMNVDPNAANVEDVLPEYFLNNSLVGAQQNPDTAERSFVMYWKTAGRQQGDNDSFALGTYDDGWSNNYWNDLSRWLTYANLAITIGEEKNEDGSAENYNDNVIQISRIWRAYLMSEMSDNWGSIPIEGFQGENPDFNSQKDVYHYILDELKDAVAQIDSEQAGMDSDTKKIDVAYEMDWEKWIRYGNSMRMRLAMRLSEVEPSVAQEHFEDAVKDDRFISSADDIFKVVEKDGWSGLTGVMSRPWNEQILSETLNNIMLGLGGVKSGDQLASELKSAVKPAGYIGLKFDEQFPKKTNDPSVGYFFDGLPNSIDPRAYANFYIPGYHDNKASADDFNNADDDEMKRKMKYEDGTEVIVNTKWTWSTYPIGEWGKADSRNEVSGYAQFAPAVGQQYRDSGNERVFFGNWESYFLIAEANLRGWSTPISDEEAYNKGIEESFNYNEVSQFASQYMTSTDYSRVGTSVKYSHTTEPPASVKMDYVNGKSGKKGTVSYKYPKNDIYESGNVNNDKLTKIITQKFIANTPWLPLETWSDHRRLGLPFFENPAVDNSITNLPDLNSSNYMKASWDNFPQRIPYPSDFKNGDPEGHLQAVDFLQGGDKVLTPLWWAKKGL